MEEVDFTDDEISKELADLGYDMIPAEQFHQFKKGIWKFVYCYLFMLFTAFVQCVAAATLLYFVHVSAR